jgi:LuxR family transcriptional regulator, quorum-sensing system regulator BjaR1
MALLRRFNLRTGAMRMSEADSGFVREAYEVLEDFDRRTTVDGVIDVTRRALTCFGFDFFCFNTFPNRGQRFEDVTIAIHVPPEWVRIYNEREYVRIDPRIRYCRQMVRPFRWSDAPYDLEREPEVLPFLKGSADFALTNGFWFPIPGRRGTVGGVWMGGPKAEVVERDLPLLHLIALSAFELLRRLRRPPGVPIPLTPREREVLSWAAQGKSAWETGEILGIAKRTVDEHVQTASRKLNAVNRTQAVVAALRERFISV